jgi:hypothetical protein
MSWEDAMRKPLREAISALRAARLQVIGVRQGSKHTEVLLADGRVYRLSKGTKVDSNFTKIARDSARQLARTSPDFGGTR